MASPDIAERLNCIISEHTTDRRRARELEELTGIPASNWKNAWSKKQRPTCHMIEAISKQWPQYAFWLSTGLTDPLYGHSAPEGAWGLNPCVRANEEQEAATQDYFAISLYLHYLIYGESVAFGNYWVEKQTPIAKELKRQAKLISSDTSWEDNVQTEDLEKVFMHKYRDLNQAADDLARKRWVDKQIGRFQLEGMDNEQQKARLAELQMELLNKRRLMNDDQAC